MIVPNLSTRNQMNLNARWGEIGSLSIAHHWTTRWKYFQKKTK